MPNLAGRPPGDRIPPGWAAVLSYIMPGLGQIFQGRVAKGLLFMVCLYSLFFYGMYLGSWKNVFVPRIARGASPLSAFLADVWHRKPFAGQFWIGAAAWPALYQYATYDGRLPPGKRWDDLNDDERAKALSSSLFGSFELMPSETELNDLQRDGDKTWDLGWVYTVIAGVLNVLVIYDALAGAALAETERAHRLERERAAA
jgi:hypothetical protein